MPDRIQLSPENILRNNYAGDNKYLINTIVLIMKVYLFRKMSESTVKLSTLSTKNLQL